MIRNPIFFGYFTAADHCARNFESVRIVARNIDGDTAMIAPMQEQTADND